VSHTEPALGHTDAPARRTIGIDGTPLYRRVDGIGRYSANLVRATAESRPDWHYVVVGFADDRTKPYLLPDLPNVERVYLPFPRRAYQALYSYVARVPVTRLVPRLDAFVCTNYTTFPAIRGVPTLVAVFDLTYVDLPDVVERRNLGYLRRHVPRTMTEADGVLAISAFTARRIDEVFPGHPPVRVVDCGLDPGFLEARSPEPLDTPLPDAYILCVGTLEPRKNLVALLRAYAGLDDGVRSAYPLVVVGRSGWGSADLPDDISRAVVDEVRFTGYVDDAALPDVFRGASLFVFPSLYEGFGLPLLEAMASGVPAVVSDIAPFRAIGQDVVEYVDPSDRVAFTRAIERGLTERDTSRTARAQATAEAFTWQRSARQLVAAIGELWR
jgi:glycosyltransferase involved in cell wall biosynthesis